eukprot:15447435-Alexandrium_andersonii.AAC.1
MPVSNSMFSPQCANATIRCRASLLLNHPSAPRQCTSMVVGADGKIKMAVITPAGRRLHSQTRP